jgi:hypothetical protein
MRQRYSRDFANVHPSTLMRELQNSRRSLLGDFADLWHLMQTPYSKEYVNLHQMPNLGKIARKSIGRIVLQFPLMKNLHFFKRSFRIVP